MISPLIGAFIKGNNMTVKKNAGVKKAESKKLCIVKKNFSVTTKDGHKVIRRGEVELSADEQAQAKKVKAI